MENQKEFNEKLEKIRENTILEVSQWWGLNYAGYSGTLITKNKEIYTYQFYIRIPEKIKDKKPNFISKNKELTEEEFDKVIYFIKEEILNKEFKDERIFDAGFNVSINYNGTRRTIKNNKGFENNLKLYDKSKILIDGLLNKKY